MVENHYMGQMIQKSQSRMLAAPRIGTAQRPDFVDLSNYDISTNINWVSLKNVGFKAVVVKTSEGTDYKDTQASNHILNAKSQGLLTHGYHFYRGTAITEAKYAIQCAKEQGLQAGSFLFMDFEDSSVSGNWYDQVIAFAHEIQLAGFKAGLYSGEYLYKTHLDYQSLHDAGVYTWIANYTERPATKHDAWQFSSSFSVPNYTRKTVDVSLDYGGEVIKVNNDPEKDDWDLLIPNKVREKIKSGGYAHQTRLGFYRSIDGKKVTPVLLPDGVHLSDEDLTEIADRLGIYEIIKQIKKLSEKG